MSEAVEPMVPLNGGVVLVFNSIQQGMYRKFRREIDNLKDYFKKQHLTVPCEMFAAFGPFDNILRFNTDDFSVLTPLSSLSYVSSQQIQYAYPIWKSTDGEKTQEGKKPENRRPFCLITQLKIQNHLSLFKGPEIEPAVARMIIEAIQSHLKKEINGQDNAKEYHPGEIPEVEVMASLGWDEFLIFSRCRKGFSSMVSLILDSIRQKTLADLEKFMNDGFYPGDDDCKRKKHIFLTTHTTPGFEMDLMSFVEEEIRTAYEMKRNHNNDAAERVSSHRVSDTKTILTLQDLETEFQIYKKIKNRYGYQDEYEFDSISVSTRLSVKPGHCSIVRQIINKIMENKWPQEPHPGLNNTHSDSSNNAEGIYSIGRYDMYPWLAERFSSMELAVRFGLLIFSLAGNLIQDGNPSHDSDSVSDDEHGLYLSRTQYYNSFTIISLPFVDREPDIDAEILIPEKQGAFLKGLYDKLALSKKNNRSIPEQIQGNALLREWIPLPVINGLARIFALFDSCLTDRFTCDTFLDMLPFMRRLSDIINSIEMNEEDNIVFRISGVDRDEKQEYCSLPEWNSNPGRKADVLTELFDNAINRFYRGFSHRFLSSYPMMDKNETGVDFSGRLHRVLSATTGMQNILFADLNFHMEEGFNTVSNYPGIRIYRDSFNTTESNVLNLFQLETFCVFYHEIIHSISRERKAPGSIVREAIDNICETFMGHSDYQARESLRILMEELAGDIFMLKTAFNDDFSHYTFWFWLMIVKRKKQLDSQILYRFLLLAQERNALDILKTISEQPDPKGDDIHKLLWAAPPEGVLPKPLKEMMEKEITGFIRDHLLDAPSRIHKFWMAFQILSRAAKYLYKKTVPAYDSCCENYKADRGNRYDSWVSTHATPIRPEKYSTEPQRSDDPRVNSSEALPRLKRQKSSIRLLRKTLTFIYQQRERLLWETDSIINFSPEESELRLSLFRLRIALLNTLQWEALRWKAEMLESSMVTFSTDPNSGENISAEK